MISAKVDSSAKRALGIDSQTVLGLPPVEHVKLAARLGCRHVSIGLESVPWHLPDIDRWSLRSDRGLRNRLVQTAADQGVVLALGEGFVIRKGTQAHSFAPDLDLMAAMGVSAVSTCGLDAALDPFLEQLAILADLTADRGLTLLLEFAPPHAVPDLRSALHAINGLGQPHVRLVIDSMHFLRGDNSLEALAAINPQRIGRAQLSDAPLDGAGKDYIQEACFERLLPGDGELPLPAFIQALPAETPIGLEIPNRSASSNIATLTCFVAQAVERSVKVCDGR